MKQPDFSLDIQYIKPELSWLRVFIMTAHLFAELL